ncbi:MAG: PAS domain S-box protein [Sulfurisoma sp.]|nr:PAS domain S-box protein [Sulfurisoma sp.]
MNALFTALEKLRLNIKLIVGFSVGLLVVEESGGIVLANPAGEKLFGYAAGELVGATLALIMPANVIADRQAGAVSSVAGLRKDGSEFPLMLSLSPLPARGNRGRCVSVAVRAAGPGA